MILEVVRFGHPVLRRRGQAVERVTAEIRRLIEDMLETMRAAHGVGLAAQQVGLALQLTVLDVSEVTERPSTLEIDGASVDPAGHMPMVLINPEVTAIGAPVGASEGCLSFPEIYAEILRPESVEVRALNADGRPIAFRCGGLLARAVQHEVDHLRGILFIDRMERETLAELKPRIEALQAATKAALAV
jgi:peptide deformylase